MLSHTARSFLAAQWGHDFRPDYLNLDLLKRDVTAWKRGTGGFGSKGTPGARVGTGWTGREIWLRRRFPTGAAVATGWTAKAS